MINTYLYIGLLLLMIILCIRAFIEGIKTAPRKIKVYNSISTLGLTLRYITLFILFIIQGMNYIYFTKYLVYINFMAIPCVIALCMYIFMRVDGLKFNYFFTLMILALGFYTMIIALFPVSIELHNFYGYILKFLSQDRVYLLYIVVLSIALMITVIGYGKKNSLTFGVFMIMLSIMVMLGEILLKLMGNPIVANTLLGEGLILITLNMGIKTFK